MSIAWTTIVILLFVLPGLAFFVGLYSSERISREVTDWKTPGQLSGILFPSIIIHTALGLALWFLFGKYALKQLNELILLYQQYNASHNLSIALARLTLGFTLATMSYLILSGLSGFWLGKASAWLLLKGLLPGLIRHSWLNDLSKKRVSPIIRLAKFIWGKLTCSQDNEPSKIHFGKVSALTTIEENGQILMYTGLLREFYAASDGTISYLVLESTERHYMSLKADFPTTTQPDPQSGALITGRLVITGDNISNLFINQDVAFTATLKEEQQLNAATQ